MRRDWTEDEVRVLAAIYFKANFSVGDDARDECRTIAACFGRTASAIDRQWRNLDAVAKNKTGLNIGNLVKETVTNFLTHPAAYRQLALHICDEKAWPLVDLIIEGHQSASNKPLPQEIDENIGKLLQRFAQNLEFKLFPAGSQGFTRQGDIEYDGDRYQVQISAVAVGTKENPSKLVRSKPEDLAGAMSVIMAKVEKRIFGTGRRGFYGAGRATVNGETFQVTVRAFQISDTKK